MSRSMIENRERLNYWLKELVAVERYGHDLEHDYLAECRLMVARYKTLVG